MKLRIPYPEEIIPYVWNIVCLNMSGRIISVHSRIQNPVRHARCVRWNFLGRYLMARSQKLYFFQKLHFRCLTGLNECLTGSAVADFMVFLYLTLNTFNTAFSTLVKGWVASVFMMKNVFCKKNIYKKISLRNTESLRKPFKNVRKSLA